ncbi:MAG: hypothetical protein ACI8QZ_000153 [Chlamydiales bacterium]|jgi:hypothetical protein
MKRTCCLCGSACETLRQARWNLPHLDSQMVGFGLCNACGLVQQTSSVTPEDMTRYYRESAVYTNPGRAGRPSAGKVRGVRQALSMVEECVGRPASSVFQVGCSDGYTLSCFQEAGASSVGGVDPSAASCEHARASYGIETIVGTAEEIEFPRGVEMWILTHVLEHLYDPLGVMRRIRAAQEPSDWVLVEVPLFEQVHRFPPSYLTFEHLSYFGEASLLELLGRAGYVAEQVQKCFSEDLYPIIRVLARASDGASAAVGRGKHDIPGSRAGLLAHLEHERSSWSGVEGVVKAALEPGARAWLWGAGIHSSQMLAYTELDSHLDIQGLLDSSPIRHGQKFGAYGIHNPMSTDLRDGAAIVISSHAAETEIWNALAAERAAGVQVVRLYAGADQVLAESCAALEMA